jgi:hypothetical protein
MGMAQPFADGLAGCTLLDKIAKILDTADGFLNRINGNVYLS